MYCLSYNISKELSIMAMIGDAIFKEKLTGGVKNDMRNFILIF